MVIGMFRADTMVGRLTDLAGAILVETLQLVHDVVSAVCDQNFLPWLKEHFDSFPSIRDQASTRSRSLKYARGRREPIRRHTVSAQIQHCANGRIERIVLVRVNMS